MLANAEPVLHKSAWTLIIPPCAVRSVLCRAFLLTNVLCRMVSLQTTFLSKPHPQLGWCTSSVGRRQTRISDLSESQWLAVQLLAAPLRRKSIKHQHDHLLTRRFRSVGARYYFGESINQFCFPGVEAFCHPYKTTPSTSYHRRCPRTLISSIRFSWTWRLFWT